MFAQKFARMILLSTGLGVLAFAGATIAAEKPQSFVFSGPIPPQFIISPEDGARIHDHLSIASEVAERLSHICQANAKMHGGSATIAILGSYWPHAHEHRIDGQSY